MIDLSCEFRFSQKKRYHRLIKHAASFGRFNQHLFVQHFHRHYVPYCYITYYIAEYNKPTIFMCILVLKNSSDED